MMIGLTWLRSRYKQLPVFDGITRAAGINLSLKTPRYGAWSIERRNGQPSVAVTTQL